MENTLSAFEMRKISIKNNKQFKSIYTKIEEMAKNGINSYSFIGKLEPNVRSYLIGLRYTVVSEPIVDDKTKINKTKITVTW